MIAHAAETDVDLNELVDRRCAGEPLEYVVGWALFAGLRIAVAPGVFVPRRRTEHLARLAVDLARRAGPRPRVLDLCCGAGAIAALVGAEVPGVDLLAADVDPAAADCARHNAPDAQVYVGDLFAALPAHRPGRLDVIVANVPYVPTDDIVLLPAEAREHERRTALDGGPDGLELARRVFTQAPEWLAPGGAVLVELTADQARRFAGDVDATRLALETVADERFGGVAFVGRVPATA